MCIYAVVTETKTFRPVDSLLDETMAVTNGSALLEEAKQETNTDRSNFVFWFFLQKVPWYSYVHLNF